MALLPQVCLIYRQILQVVLLIPLQLSRLPPPPLVPLIPVQLGVPLPPLFQRLNQLLLVPQDMQSVHLLMSLLTLFARSLLFLDPVFPFLHLFLSLLTPEGLAPLPTHLTSILQQLPSQLHSPLP